MRDVCYDVWICEVKFEDNKWYPVPDWGAGYQRRDARERALAYCIANEVLWALTPSRLLNRRVRCRRYIPVKKED